jgi:DNA-binding winged helix-turn-helix (wHTH) protein
MFVTFGDFVLDRAARQLRRGEEALHLEPKAFELLDLLVGRRPEAVSKRDIRDRLWPDTFVSESSLTGLVGQIRQALGDNPRRPRFVRTVHAFGYAFSGEASEGTAVTVHKGHPAAWVIWGKWVVPLETGENVFGREEDARVRIDSPGVSRRHARIVIREGQATLEDLGSKNGTFLGERRLAAPARLEDGDTFRLGREIFVFRTSTLEGSTRTERESR